MPRHPVGTETIGSLDEQKAKVNPPAMARSAERRGTPAPLPVAMRPAVAETRDRRSRASEVAAALARPARLFARGEILARPSPAPREPGLYGWFFERVPPGVPTEGCAVSGGRTLLYVGIAPSRPATEGATRRRATLRSRLRQHLRGNASASTLRLTLGCLLARELGIALHPTGRTGRLTFGDGERALSAWLAANARIAWTTHDAPWTVEADVIHSLCLPFNLQHNATHAFHAKLKQCRAAARESARGLADAKR